jgi:hypothetical protein
MHGAYVERGYMQHAKIMSQYPELQLNEEADYNPPHGYVRVDCSAKVLYYTRYDQSKFGIPGTTDSADAHEVDTCIRKRFNIPSDFKSISYSPAKWWHNDKTFCYTKFL